MAVVNEVVTKFSFQGSIDPLTKYNKSGLESIKILGAMAAATTAAAGAFAAWTTSVLGGIDPMIQLSRSTGVAVESMQELGFIASQNGSDLQAVQSTVSELSKKIGEAAQRGSEDFSRLGISIRDMNGNVKGTEQILDEVSASFQRMGLSLPEQQDFAQRLGIDSSLIQTLNLSGDQMDALREKARALGIVTTEQANAAAAYNDSLTTLKFGMSAIQNQVAIGLAPVLQGLAEQFTDFMVRNKDLITNGLQAFGKALTIVGASIARMTPVVLGAAAAFGVWKVATVGLGAVLGALFSPITLVVGGVTALWLAVDDLIVGMRGGESVIANFFKNAFGIDVLSGIQSAIDGITKSIEWMIWAFDQIKSGNFGAVFDSFSGQLIEQVQVLIPSFDDLNPFGGPESVSASMNGETEVAVNAVGAQDLVPTLDPAPAQLTERVQVLTPNLDSLSMPSGDAFNLRSGQLTDQSQGLMLSLENLNPIDDDVVNSFSGELSKKVQGLIPALENLNPVDGSVFDLFSSQLAEWMQGLVADLENLNQLYSPDPAFAGADYALPDANPDSDILIGETNFGRNAMGAQDVAPSVTMTNSVNQDVQINIATNNPEAASQAVQDGLQKQLRRARDQVGRGGL